MLPIINSNLAILVLIYINEAQSIYIQYLKEWSQSNSQQEKVY